MIAWKSNYCAEVLNVCQVEIVQVDGMSMIKSNFSNSMTTQGNTNNDSSANHRKLNMYMVLFHRAE